ncbi:MAG: hypothetical protein EON57_02735, partial [Alphaproteobacteria bacterium]
MRKLLLPLVVAVLATPAMAQSPTSTPPAEFDIELNALTASETGCRVTFLATNKLGTELTRSALEIALFGADGGIDRLVSLEFKAMPEGKARVLQFDIGGLTCENISRVLINDVVACEGEGLDPKVCL